MWLTQPGQMRQTEGLTGLVHSSTDVFPGCGGHRYIIRGQGTALQRYLLVQLTHTYMLRVRVYVLCITCLVINTERS